MLLENNVQKEGEDKKIQKTKCLINGRMDNIGGGQRLPPDGDEFPAAYQELYTMNDSKKIMADNNKKKSIEIAGYHAKEKLAREDDVNTVPPLPTTKPPNHLITRRKAPSPSSTVHELSVKDKIAMFSSQCNNYDANQEISVFPLKLKRCDNSNPISRATSFSGLYPIPNNEKIQTCSSETTNNNPQISRTNSLASTFNRPSCCDEARRNSLSQLIEQRRKGISKLKGLIIPERETVPMNQAIVDLPEIKSRESIVVDKVSKTSNFYQDRWSSTQTSSLPNGNSAASKLQTFKIAAPKVLMSNYSPAFKRKTLSICGSSGLIPTSTPSPDAPKSLESICSPTRSECSFDFLASNSSTNNHNNFKYDDSDNDSAVSSSQSSISRGFSPSSSPIPSERSYISSNHVLTGSNMNEPLCRRVLKPQSVEAINRKNILASARCRSGRDLNGSPLIQRKFSNEKTENDGSTGRKSNLPIPKTRSLRSSDMKSWLKSEMTSENNCHDEYSFKNNRSSQADSNNAVPSVTDIKKIFEKSDLNQTPSLESNPDENCQFGSISSLASSTSLISQQELAQLVEEANLEEPRQGHDLTVVLLHKENPSGGIGITLAGGIDCEAKEITVHRVLKHSIADKDGTIQRGDRILSINGRSMKGLTHKESLTILKQPRSEVVLVVSRAKRTESVTETIAEGFESNGLIESSTAWGPPVIVAIYKDGAGLGFSLEGGRDSPLGDKPLLIKKIFTGGAAEKTGALKAGDQLLEVNNKDVSRMSRIEAWSLMKKLVDGEVTLLVRHPATKSS